MNIGWIFLALVGCLVAGIFLKNDFLAGAAFSPILLILGVLLWEG